MFRFDEEDEGQDNANDGLSTNDEDVNSGDFGNDTEEDGA